MYLKKLFVFLSVLHFTVSSFADFSSLRRQSQNRSSSSAPSFKLFQGSLINCTKLRDGDDYSILYHPGSGSYNFFERMYSWRKDCTLEQELFNTFANEDVCFSQKLEQLTEEAEIIANEFENELKDDFSIYQHYTTTNIRFLISDQRPNLIEYAFNSLKEAVSGSNEVTQCPWDFSIHIEIRFINRSGSDVFEKIIDVPTF